jgi:hypothetical protein
MSDDKIDWREIAWDVMLKSCLIQGGKIDTQGSSSYENVASAFARIGWLKGDGGIYSIVPRSERPEPRA